MSVADALAVFLIAMVVLGVLAVSCLLFDENLDKWRDRVPLRGKVMACRGNTCGNCAYCDDKFCSAPRALCHDFDNRDGLRVYRGRLAKNVYGRWRCQWRKMDA